MKNIRNLAAVVLAAGSLAACSGLEVFDAEKAQPKGDAFSTTLYKQYIALAKTEYAEGDYIDSDVFSIRARDAAAGKPAAPEAVTARKQTKKNAKALSAAREKLVKALSGDARTRMPGEAAMAQAKYECWAQEQEENFQVDDIDNCRIGFYTALAKANYKPPVKKKPKPKPAPKPKPLSFLVKFDFDSSTLNEEAKAVLAEAAKAIMATKPKNVSVIGHTDRAGADGYNIRLGERRANAVAEELVKAGVSGRLLTLGSLGEHAPAVKTPDGARNPDNRRTEISVRY